MLGSPASEKSDPYEFKIALSDNDEPEDFLLFVCNFNMTLEASGTLKDGIEVQYLHTLVHGEALSQFDALYFEVEGSTPLTLEDIILGLGTKLFLLMRYPSKSARCAA